MKPDWKDAPEWAKWMAMDDDGVWAWFEHQPMANVGGWRMCGGRASEIEHDDWESTLEPRP